MVRSNTVQYTKLRRCEDGNGSEDEITVPIDMPPPLEQSRQRSRELWLRTCTAMILLSIALAFISCEWYGCISEKANNSAHSVSNNSEAKLGHDHNGTEDDGHKSEEHHGHPSSVYHHGVVISDSDICSTVGKGVLKGGGNVADAGIASLLCLGVVHPHTTGVGGAFSAIIYNQTSGISKGIHSAFQGKASATYGIPATMQSIHLLHSQFGRSKWEHLFTDSIHLAKEGFPIDESLAVALKSKKEQILKSGLCNLFCYANGSVKTEGSIITNQNLSELLRSISVSDSHFLDHLGPTLAQDLSSASAEDFVQHVQQTTGEINDPLIIAGEEYTVLTVASALSNRILSKVLSEGLIQSIWASMDLHSHASEYTGLFNTAQIIYSQSLAAENKTLEDLSSLNTVNSVIGVLDNAGNVLIICSSLNSSFGSMQLLPSTGVILSDFSQYSPAVLPQLSFPSVVKLHSDEDEERAVFGIGVTGGFSAPFVVAQIVHRLHLGVPALESVSRPLLHLEMGSRGSLSACVSAVSNSSDIYERLAEDGQRMQAVGKCAEDTLAVVLQLHAGHVGGYSAPRSRIHNDGY